MPGVGGVRGPPPLGDDPAVPDDHDAVERVDAAVGRLDEGEDGPGGDALLLGGTPRQVGRGGGEGRDDQREDGERPHGLTS